MEKIKNSENNRLNLQITTTQDENNRLNLQITTTQDTFSREIGKYEKELSDTRQLLDETAKEKGRLQLDAGRSRAELGELTQKFNKAKNDLQVEKQVQVLLQSTLQELRDQYKSQIQVIQKSTDEVKALYHYNVEDLEDQIEKQRNSATSHYEELFSARNRLKDATLKLSNLQLANSHMKDRIGELERNLETERQAHATAREQMAIQSEEYQDFRCDLRNLLRNLNKLDLNFAL